jgi:CBS domain-containing protein
MTRPRRVPCGQVAAGRRSARRLFFCIRPRPVPTSSCRRRSALANSEVHRNAFGVLMFTSWAAQAMHKGVKWVGPDTPVTEVAKLMCADNIGAIPIGENDRLIGMVTDRDIVCKGLAQDSFDVRRTTARNVMTPGIHCCREDDDLAKAVRHMEMLEVRRLPVINKSKRMVGMLALGDVSDLAPSDLLSEYVKRVSAHH